MLSTAPGVGGGAPTPGPPTRARRSVAARRPHFSTAHAFDLACTLPRPDALATLDRALRLGVQPRLKDRVRGAAQARELLTLADARAESPQESRLRLICVDGGLPRPIPQFIVTDDLGFEVYRVDLAWPESRTALEYDSTEFHSGAALYRDRARHNWLTQHGWTMIYATARDVYRDHETLVRRIRTTLDQHNLSGAS